MKKTLILHHSADLDGVLSGVIAHYYLSRRAGTDDIIIHHGADYGDKLDVIYTSEQDVNIYALKDFDEIYVIDFSDKWLFESEHSNKIIWIDHHIRAIEDYKKNKYRLKDTYLIDGVAACRLTQQYMANLGMYPFLQDFHFINREIQEPFFVTLAGEYDIWDKESVLAIPFNFGVSTNLSFEYIKMLYEELKNVPCPYNQKSRELDEMVINVQSNPRWKWLIEVGKAVVDSIQQTSSKLNGGIQITINGVKGRAFNTHYRSSLIHRLQDPDKFIMVWNYTGSSQIKCSFYSEEEDVSKIACYFGGGGHIHACGCHIDLHTLTHILTKSYEFRVNG